MNKIVILGTIGIIVISIIGVNFLNMFSDNVFINHEQEHITFDESSILLDTDNPIKIGILHSLSDRDADRQEHLCQARADQMSLNP